MSQCCNPLNIPCMAPGWSCGVCKPSTYNGNNRDSCKECGHDRCDTPAVKRVPFRTEEGYVVVPVRTRESDQN